MSETCASHPHWRLWGRRRAGRWSRGRRATGPATPAPWAGRAAAAPRRTPPPRPGWPPPGRPLRWDTPPPRTWEGPAQLERFRLGGKRLPPGWTPGALRLKRRPGRRADPGHGQQRAEEGHHLGVVLRHRTAPPQVWPGPPAGPTTGLGLGSKYRRWQADGDTFGGRGCCCRRLLDDAGVKVRHTKSGGGGCFWTLPPKHQRPSQNGCLFQHGVCTKEMPQNG